MKHYFITLLLLSNAICVFSQKNTILEIVPYGRIDWYPEFSYVWSGRVSTDYVKISGVSIGTDIIYKIPISKKWSLRPGLGYFKYTFNDIKKTNTMFGDSDSRHINFISPLLIPFLTDEYWYHSISVNVGMERVILKKGKYQVQVTADIKNYWTFSQLYHLTKNPLGSQDFKKKDTRYFGTSALLGADLIKSFGKFGIGASVKASVFDIWKTDSVFPEETGNEARNKIFSGIGLGLIFNYSLNKKS